MSQHSRQIFVPRRSWVRTPPTSPGRPQKFLFDVSLPHPKGVPEFPILPSQRRRGDVLIWRPGDALIWRSWYVSGRLIQDVPRTFSGCPKLGCPKIYFNHSFRIYSIHQIYLKAFQHSRCTEKPVKLLNCSIFCEIN